MQTFIYLLRSLVSFREACFDNFEVFARRGAEAGMIVGVRLGMRARVTQPLHFVVFLLL